MRDQQAVPLRRTAAMVKLPFAARAAPHEHDDAAIAEAQLWIADNYATANPVSEMTRISGLTPRPSSDDSSQRRLMAPRLCAVAPDRGGQADAGVSDNAIDDIAEDVGTWSRCLRRLFERATGLFPCNIDSAFSSWLQKDEVLPHSLSLNSGEVSICDVSDSQCRLALAMDAPEQPRT